MSLFDRIKTAARWADEMAKGTLSPEAVERLRQAEGLGIRQIGRSSIDAGAEKDIYNAFGGGGLGELVSKRIRTEVTPEVEKRYLDLAKKHPELINPPVAEHRGGGGWIEKKLKPLAYGEHYEKSPEGKLRFYSNVSEPLTKTLKSIGGEHLGLGRYAPDYRKNPVLGLPGGVQLYDVHEKNIGMTSEGKPRIFDAIPAVAGEKRIPYAQAKVKSPRAKGLRTRIREGLTGPKKAPTAKPKPAVNPKPKPAAQPKRPPIKRKLPGVGTV